VLHRDGLRTITSYFTDSPPEAHAIFIKTLQDISSERLALLMERTAIEEYLQEGGNGR
jgi:hypothetical protein